MTDRVSVFGSTGSVGGSVLEVIRTWPDRFAVHALVAGTSGRALLDQVREFRPAYAGLARDPEGAFRDALAASNRATGGSTRYVPPHETDELAADRGASTVVAAVSGTAGLGSTLAAAGAGRRVLVANKESVVCAGALLLEAAGRSGARIVPVDSEHSALFQLLGGDELPGIRPSRRVARVTLTASGGPFLGRSAEEVRDVTPDEAVRHPKWSMGPKISVDSATLVNKGLELIEACVLFGLPPDRVEVVIHPQSIVHALVGFEDGTEFAHLSVADMKGPAAYALAGPDRLPGVMRPLSLAAEGRLEFFPLDPERFPAMPLARRAAAAGGGASATYCVADEVAVRRFLRGHCRFGDIVTDVARAVDEFAGREVESADDVRRLEADVGRFLSP